MTSRDFELWAEASLTHDTSLAATLPAPAPDIPTSQNFPGGAGHD